MVISPFALPSAGTAGSRRMLLSLSGLGSAGSARSRDGAAERCTVLAVVHRRGKETGPADAQVKLSCFKAENRGVRSRSAICASLLAALTATM